MLRLQYFGHLMQRVDSLEKTLMLGKTEGRRRRVQQRMGWLDGIIASMDMSLSKLQEIVKEGGAWRAIVHRVAKSQIWVSDWTTKRTTKIFKWRPSRLVAHRYVWGILSGSYKLLSSPFIQEAPPSFVPLGVHQQETKGRQRLSIDKVLGVPTGQTAGHTWHSVSKHPARWASQNCGNWGGLCWGLLNPCWATLGQDENAFLQMSSEECSSCRPPAPKEDGLPCLWSPSRHKGISTSLPSHCAPAIVQALSGRMMARAVVGFAKLSKRGACVCVCVVGDGGRRTTQKELLQACWPEKAYWA